MCVFLTNWMCVEMFLLGVCKTKRLWWWKHGQYVMDWWNAVVLLVKFCYSSTAMSCETVRVPLCSAHRLRFLLSYLYWFSFAICSCCRLACMLCDKFIFGLKCFIECLKCSYNFVYFSSYIYTRPLLLICNCCHKYNRIPVDQLRLVSFEGLSLFICRCCICSHKYNTIEFQLTNWDWYWYEGRLEAVYISMLTSVVHEG